MGRRLKAIAILRHHKTDTRLIQFANIQAISDMRRINRLIFSREEVLFDLEDVVTLLAYKREEKFEGERAVRFFQFRTWILFPDTDETNYAKWAELITAVKYLDWAEADHFWDEETERLRKEGEPPFVDLTFKPPQTTHRIITLMTNNNAYRQIFDRLIGRRGGLLALLNTPSLADFDRATYARIDRMHIVSDLIDYRLRYIQHGIGNGKVNADPDGENLNHAMFFFWWPTREVQSSRGKTSPNKAVSTKTMRIWWSKFENSALFIYLIHKHGFRQLPMDTDDDVFVENLLRESNDTEELHRFFGAYAYVAEAFREARSDLIYVSVPESIPRIPISTPPFSKTELETISLYDDKHLLMTQ